MNKQTLNDTIAEGTIREINNKTCVYYSGYWILHYEIPTEANASYSQKKYLIKMLTRRVFRNTESCINTPGHKLNEARDAYESADNESLKRVNAAMLAGALLNRATDILTQVVELQKSGVIIDQSNDLIRQCGKHLMEALELGKHVKHYSGAEGIDELWGEPFKAFSYPIEEFYKSRYQKIGLSMAMIDNTAQIMLSIVGVVYEFKGLENIIEAYCTSAKQVAETAKDDPIFLDLWPQFVVNGETIVNFNLQLSNINSVYTREARDMLRAGKELICHIASARVPMPVSFKEYHQQCHDFLNRIT